MDREREKEWRESAYKVVQAKATAVPGKEGTRTRPKWNEENAWGKGM